MTSAFSWQNCQPLTFLVLYSKTKFACYSRYFLTSYFCIWVPYNEKDIFWGVSSRRSCRSSLELFSFSFFSIIGWGIDLDHCDIEWFASEMNRDHSVVFEIASKYCMESIPFVSDSVYSMKVKVAQSCPTLCDPMYYTVHGILQARLLEWIAFPFSRRSSQPRDQS